MRRIAYDHLLALTDDTGTFQHAKGLVPWREHGYCSDDVCRALIIAVREGRFSDRLLRIRNVSVSFLLDAWNPAEGFRNFMGYDRRWLEDVGSPDSQARVLWSLAYLLKYELEAEDAFLVRELFEQAVPMVARLDSPRTEAYLLIALGIVDWQGPERAALRERLFEQYAEFATPDWPWFERYLTYCNAIFPQALLLDGHQEGVELGLKTLSWLFEHEISFGKLAPTGNEGWARPGFKAEFDQQPVEAMELSMAAVRAYRITRDPIWEQRQRICLGWFHGLNALAEPIGEERRGIGYDGLSPSGISRNAGAESTISYLSVLQDAQEMRVLAM